MPGLSLISLTSTTFWRLRASADFFCSRKRYLPKSRILQTGGVALGTISTRSSAASSASCWASERLMTPRFCPSASISWTWMARMSRLVRGPSFSGCAVAFMGRRMATLLLLAFESAPPLKTHANPPYRAMGPEDRYRWVRKGAKSIVGGGRGADTKRDSGSRSFLRQPRLPEALEHGRKVRRMFLHPLDRDCWVEPAGFGEFGLRLIHLAGLRVGGGRVRMDEIHPLQTHVERLAIFVDRRLEMAQPDLSVAQVDAPKARSGVARTYAHRPLQ